MPRTRSTPISSRTPQLAYQPTLTGREAIESATAGAAGALSWVRHEVDQVAEVNCDQLSSRFTIHTATPGGEPVSLPCVTVIWLHDDHIVHYLVHLALAAALGAGASWHRGRASQPS